MARMQGLTLAKGNRGLLVVAALAGLAAAVLFVAAVNQDGGTSNVSTSGATVKAVVAKQNIAARTEIKSDMVEVREVSEELLVTGAFSDTELVVGNVTLGAIPAGEQIISSRIGLAPTSDSLSAVVPNGKRAVSVEVREATAVGGLLRNGDRVDVIGVFDPQNANSALVFESGGTPAFGVPLLQNIEVLAVGQTAQEPLPTTERDPDGDGTPNVSTSGIPSENTEPQPGATTVTLAVNPDQAITLALTQQTGIKVWLTLRAFGDVDEVEMPKVDIGSVVGP
jgi:pilus assembly protein CpaB